jgi:hypothetical protein
VDMGLSCASFTAFGRRDAGVMSLANVLLAPGV